VTRSVALLRRAIMSMMVRVGRTVCAADGRAEDHAQAAVRTGCRHEPDRDQSAEQDGLQQQAAKQGSFQN